MPSVAYWTSALYPEMEAIAGEVALLRRHFRPSVAWGISPARWFQLSWRRGFQVHPRLHLGFRAATWVMQRAFCINHLFGTLGDWFHLKAAHKRPTVLTVVASSEPCTGGLLKRVDRFTVEWPGARDELSRLGIDRDRVRLIFPPVDTQRFYPAPRPEGPFTVLFASSPDRVDWLEARGVPLLLDVAAALPNYRFRLLWRPWGNAYEIVEQRIRERGLSNVDLRRGRVVNMPAEYHAVHATVAPFTDQQRCKAVPNSLLESLASGRPVIATRHVGLAELIAHDRLGVACDATVEEIVDAICQIEADWRFLSAQSRAAADKHFALRHFVDAYSRLYEEVLSA